MYTLLMDKLVKENKNLHLKGENNMALILEDLKDKRLISNFDNRPSDRLTDEKWQQEFQIWKDVIKPCSKKTKKLSVMDFRKENNISYHKRIDYPTYCTYMNGVLENIQKGATDFCYYTYQILDLLKFYKDELRTKYFDDDKYWAVWLER